jgi:hypothetical protein
MAELSNVDAELAERIRGMQNEAGPARHRPGGHHGLAIDG